MKKREARPARSPRVEYPDLATYFRESGDTQLHMARVLGMLQSHLSRITSGEVIPRAALQERIASYARIPLDSFTRVYLARRRRKAARPASQVA